MQYTQRINRRPVWLLGIMLILLFSVVSLVPLLAQEDTTIITIGIEEFQQQFLNDEAFADFEAANPGVDVVTVILSNDNRYFGTPQSVEGLDTFVEDVNTFAGQADLLPLDSFNGPRLKTRAGMYLDLTPLINADADANLDDFYPAMLQSVQWDNATWGLPLSGSVQVITYDRTAFDEAGLAYPNESWTLDEYMNAGATLSEFNDDGDLTLPGFFGFNNSIFLASITGSDLSAPNQSPSLPLLATPENIALMEQWIDYTAEYYPNFGGGFDFDFNRIPLQLNSVYLLNDEFNAAPEGSDFQGALLPGGTAGLQVQAYGISGGTANPQLAYDLLQYMTRTPQTAYAFFGDYTARTSLSDADTSDLPIFRPELPDDLRVFVDNALANAIPVSQYHFNQLLDEATFRLRDEDENADVETVLQEIQEDVTDLYLAVEDVQATNIVEVATPVPTPVLQSGEIALTFGVESSFGPPADRNIWQAAIDEFVAQDSQVGQIVLSTEFMPLNERLEEQDCFYLGSNPVQSADLTQFLPLGPFLTTDTELSLDDFVNSTINQATRDNTIWAMPMAIAPQVMWYNPQTFEEASLPLPENDWNITEFVDALNALDTVIDNEPYTSQGFNGTYFYMLLAAYGGLPVDTDDSLFTFNLTDPTTVEAVRQVASLVEQGLIEYSELGSFGGGGGSFGQSENITDAILTPNDFRLQNRSDEFPVNVVMFPRGAAYTPVSYGMNVGMISSNTLAPEACYRWLSFVSRRAELLGGMPAQTDLFADATASLDTSDDVIALYDAFNDALASPSTVFIPGSFSGNANDPIASSNNFIKRNWVNRAFDKIILEDVDMMTALTDTEQFITEYDTCTAGIELPSTPIAELSQQEQTDFFRLYIRCAVDIDPSLETIFGGLLESDEE